MNDMSKKDDFLLSLFLEPSKENLAEAMRTKAKSHVFRIVPRFLIDKSSQTAKISKSENSNLG